MGIGTAMLNAALLLEKYNVFESPKSYLSEDVRHSSGTALNVNKYLAFTFFKMALSHHDTRDEAMLKLGDFYYYGMEPLEKEHIGRAAHIYKYVEQNARDSELRGQALFNLGMIYHFGYRNDEETPEQRKAQSAEAGSTPETK